MNSIEKECKKMRKKVIEWFVDGKEQKIKDLYIQHLTKKNSVLNCSVFNVFNYLLCMFFLMLYAVIATNLELNEVESIECIYYLSMSFFILITINSITIYQYKKYKIRKIKENSHYNIKYNDIYEMILSKTLDVETLNKLTKVQLKEIYDFIERYMPQQMIKESILEFSDCSLSNIHVISFLLFRIESKKDELQNIYNAKFIQSSLDALKK